MSISEEVVTIDERLSSVEEKVAKIYLLDKYNKMQEKWEKSKTRTILIAINNYFFVAIILYLLGVDNVLINAFIPAGGYILSQQSVPYIKKLWIKEYLTQESKKKLEVSERIDIPESKSI